MTPYTPELFGTNLRIARALQKVSQKDLAARSGVHARKLMRIEKGTTSPTLEETIQLATALKVSIDSLVNGLGRSAASLVGIAFQLYHLGIRDLEVEHARVPGSFRRREEAIAIAIQGDRPEPRVIEAIPVILARHSFNVPLLFAFADYFDLRIRTRLAWLADITVSLAQTDRLPFSVHPQNVLAKILAESERGQEPDSLGYPGDGSQSPIWKRWNVTYDGSLKTFEERARHIASLSATRFGDEDVA